MVGTGIFTSLGFQVGGLPSGFVLMVLWAVGGVCALCGALCYAELGAALPRSGGEYRFLGEIYHPAVGFLAGWVSATVGFAAPVALAAMAFGEYFAGVVPGANPLVCSVLVVLGATLFLLRTVRLGSVFQNGTTLLKVVLILVVIVAGGVVSHGEGAGFFLPKAGDGALLTGPAFAGNLYYVMYAYSGWNASVYIVGEVRNPGRVIPLSVGLGTLFVMGLYLGVNAAFLHSTPLAELAAAPGKIAVGLVAGPHLFGQNGTRWMAGLICAGLVSTVSAMMWIGPRVTMAMGEDYAALRWLAAKGAGGVPVRAVLVQLGVVVGLLVTLSFEKVLTYVQFSLQACAFLAVLGEMVLRVRRPDLPRPYRTWGYPVTPLVFLAVCGWMLVQIWRSSPGESALGLGTMGLGLVIYFLAPRGGAGSMG